MIITLMHRLEMSLQRLPSVLDIPWFRSLLKYIIIDLIIFVYSIQVARVFNKNRLILQSVFRGTSQPWRLGNFFGDEKFAVHKNWTGCMRELEGACNQSSMAVDTSITKELLNNLYNSVKVNGNGTESKGNIDKCFDIKTQ